MGSSKHKTLLLLAASLLLVGCGRIGFNNTDLANDASATTNDATPTIDASESVDASVVLDAAILGSFSTPTIVGELSNPSGRVTDISLTEDELEVYVVWQANAGSQGNIYVSKRAEITSSWPTPTAVAELNSGAHEGAPKVSGNGLQIMFSTQRAGTSGGDIWISVRSQRDLPWGAPSSVAELNSAALDSGATLADNGRMVVFDSDRTGNREIFVARRANTSLSWETPTIVAELSTTDSEAVPHLTTAGTTIVFARSPAGGDRDLYESQRSAIDQPFDQPTRLSEIATSSSEEDPWLSSDLRRLYFASDRSGEFHIYLATR